ncbi:MAG: adenine deaminase, partial [Deltaproteobacteria bacterium]|nr:adenine deaminase [Deltaproteobacteria bacterium]
MGCLWRICFAWTDRASGNIGHGLVRGFGFKRGAVASSVAHDSHNIVAAGMSTAEILKAVKTVVKMKGGLAVVVGDQVLAELNLPIAGLMSLSSAREVAAAGKKLRRAVRETGCVVEDPFMILSFLA